MTRIAPLAVCVFASGLLLFSRTAPAPHGPYRAPQPAPAGLEEEIKRVESEIDKIFAETLAQLPSIPSDTGNRMKRVQTLWEATPV
jgi:hypothetical protein